MPTTLLTPVLDYAFLSDPTANTVYIVERDGLVWKYDETLPGGQPHGRRQSLLPKYTQLDWKQHLSGPTVWRWLDGWLPILVLEDANHQRLEALVKGDKLLVRLAETCRRYPGGEVITPDEFDCHIDSVRKFWTAWIAEGIVLPAIDRFWDNAWRSSWVQARMIYGGLHPRYGTGTYTEARSDGFPPTTLSMVAALLTYGHGGDAQATLGYFLNRFLLPDGRIDYYGPAISEYGGLLSLASRTMHETAGGREWFLDHLAPIEAMMRYLIRCKIPIVGNTDPRFGLIQGSPEADTRTDTGAFFHNNMHAWRGFVDIARGLRTVGLNSQALEAEYHADDLAAKIHLAIEAVRNENPFLPSRVDRSEQFSSFTESNESAYVNYRYYPEMLEAGFLEPGDAVQIVQAREKLGGDLDGTTVFSSPELGTRLDDWPICSYARALLELGEHERFLRTLKGHARHHQTPDTFTAYEQVYQNGNPRLAAADWCVPCQLALPRMLAWSFSYTTRNGKRVQLGGPATG